MIEGSTLDTGIQDKVLKWRPQLRFRAPALFIPAENTMQLFMWQLDTVWVAHYIMECFVVLVFLDDTPDDASTLSSSALAAG